jgi:hypothetical protein
MSASVIMLGTYHELQGSEKRHGNVNDPLYAELVQYLIEDERIDFVFEEATDLGPTTAERLAAKLLGAGRYLDVDPSTQQRESFGIPAETNTPFLIGNPPDAGFANWQPIKMHEAREKLWLQRLSGRTFTKALMICGFAHMMSFAFRLQQDNFGVKMVDYIPRLK